MPGKSLCLMGHYAPGSDADSQTAPCGNITVGLWRVCGVHRQTVERSLTAHCGGELPVSLWRGACQTLGEGCHTEGRGCQMAAKL